VQDDGYVKVDRNSERTDAKAKHGLTRSLIYNMIVGVSEGFKIQQELNGVGYRATVKGQRLELVLGLSHPVVFEIPDKIQVSAETPKRSNPIITLESYDKQLIGQVAAKIRSLRPPEPYKGKGIRYLNEDIRRKAGKAAGKA
jgi:large subunit ribosomal protein L6